MKIKKLNKQICQEIGREIERKLSGVAKMFGVNVKVRGGKFSLTSLTQKIEISIIDVDGNILSQASDDFKRYCSQYNLKPDDLGKTFTADNGRSYEITGLKINSRKFPITAVNVETGRGYKFPEKIVVDYLKLAKKGS